MKHQNQKNNLKILYIYPNEIMGKTGGGLESRKIYFSLCKYIENNTLSSLNIISLDKKISHQINIKIRKTRLLDITSRVLGHSTYFYIVWKKIRKQIINENYDIVFLGNSRLGFVAKDLKKSSRAYLVAQFHNIEYEYTNTYSSKYKNSILRKIFLYLERKNTFNDEKLTVENIDLALFMTQKDKNTCDNIYKKNTNQKNIPICTTKTKISKISINNKKLNIIFIGTLDFPGNITGLEWFLKEIWQKIQLSNEIQLIIGGSSNTDLSAKYENKYKNLKLYQNYKNIEDIVLKNSIFISPIKSSTGMKTKVADALSSGFAIIGTQETFIGYEEALGDEDSNNILIEANTPEEFINQINILSQEMDFNQVRKKAIQLWKKYYSLERAEKEIEEIIRSI